MLQVRNIYEHMTRIEMTLLAYIFGKQRWLVLLAARNHRVTTW